MIIEESLRHKIVQLSMKINNEIYVKRAQMIQESNPGISSKDSYDIAFKGVTFDLIAELFIKTGNNVDLFREI